MKDLGKNIILIGLPGAGKTTLGKLLSNIIGYRFIDSDAFIEEKTGKSITDLFQIGEDYFRNIESDAYKEIADFEDTHREHGRRCRQTQRKYRYFETERHSLLHRPSSRRHHARHRSIPPSAVEGRIERIYALKAERETLYLDAADFVVKNDKPLEELAAEIIAHHIGAGKEGDVHDNPK